MPPFDAPSATPGWSPPVGWQPDPARPPDASHHQWWRSTSGGRRRRRLGIAVVVACTLVVGGCTAVAIVGGPCAFDPPPGDVGSLRVLNDTNATMQVADCDSGAGCTDIVATAIPPGGQVSLNVESCIGGTLGVLPAGGTGPVGCLTKPTEDSDGKLPAVRLSEAHPCGGQP